LTKVNGKLFQYSIISLFKAHILPSVLTDGPRIYKLPTLVALNDVRHNCFSYSIFKFLACT